MRDISASEPFFPSEFITILKGNDCQLISTCEKKVNEKNSEVLRKLYRKAIEESDCDNYIQLQHECECAQQMINVFLNEFGTSWHRFFCMLSLVVSVFALIVSVFSWFFSKSITIASLSKLENPLKSWSFYLSLIPVIFFVGIVILLIVFLRHTYKAYKENTAKSKEYTKALLCFHIYLCAINDIEPITVSCAAKDISDNSISNQNDNTKEPQSNSGFFSLFPIRKHSKTIQSYSSNGDVANYARSTDYSDNGKAQIATPAVCARTSGGVDVATPAVSARNGGCVEVDIPTLNAQTGGYAKPEVPTLNARDGGIAQIISRSAGNPGISENDYFLSPDSDEDG